MATETAVKGAEPLPALRPAIGPERTHLQLYGEKIFPRVMDWALSRDAIVEIRSRLLEPVGGHVLEIGFGTGLNLFHYPPTVTSLTALDSNPGMHQIARKRLRRARFPIDLRQGDCETLPMEGDTFDCVVSTFTLCSVANAEAALREIHRVMKPGGRFFFLEHGLSDRPRVARWQRRLNPVQKRLGAGCRLDRDIAALVAQPGLVTRSLNVYDLERTPRVFGHLFEGVAAKEDG